MLRLYFCTFYIPFTTAHTYYTLHFTYAALCAHAAHKAKKKTKQGGQGRFGEPLRRQTSPALPFLLDILPIVVFCPYKIGYLYSAFHFVCATSGSHVSCCDGSVGSALSLIGAIPHLVLPCLVGSLTIYMPFYLLMPTLFSCWFIHLAFNSIPSTIVLPPTMTLVSPFLCLPCNPLPACRITDYTRLRCPLLHHTCHSHYTRSFYFHTHCIFALPPCGGAFTDTLLHAWLHSPHTHTCWTAFGFWDGGRLDGLVVNVPVSLRLGHASPFIVRFIVYTARPHRHYSRRLRGCFCCCCHSHSPHYHTFSLMCYLSAYMRALLFMVLRHDMRRARP